MEIQPEITCPSCGSAIPAIAYFCLNCGKQLKDKPPAKTLSRQIIVYLVSLFLPPFGFWYAWKYLKRADHESRKIGIVAVILTIISILGSIWIAEAIINSVSQSLDLINNFNL
jgi:predicted nucleic acid-binding Zn ribbon protein